MTTQSLTSNPHSTARVYAVRRNRRWSARATGQLPSSLFVGLFTGLTARLIPRLVACLSAGLCACAAAATAASPAVLINPFHDPFVQATQGLAICPMPSPPTYTHAEMQEVEHHRVEQGNSCYLAGRCRLSNSFLYDRGIAGALLPKLRADPGLWCASA